MNAVQLSAIAAVKAATTHNGETVAEYIARTATRKGQIFRVLIGRYKVAGTAEEIMKCCGIMKIKRYHDDFVSVFTK